MVHYFLSAAPETASIPTSKGKLAVHFAAGDGHVQICSALLQHCPPSAAVPSSKGKLPLHFCARWGYLDIAYELISYYPDAVRALDWEGSLPLHDAAREGQVRMSRYLIERFPAALQTANLRGEIPLFPAVRSANVELVRLMIQAWPRGGKHILRNVSADDNITSWNDSILELLLRGAVDNLLHCPLLVGHEPPTVRLLDDVPPDDQLTAIAATSLGLKAASKKAKGTSATTAISSQSTAVQPRLVSTRGPLVMPPTLVSSSKMSTTAAALQPTFPSFAPASHFAARIPAASTTVTATTLPLVRSKSPILNGNLDPDGALNNTTGGRQTVAILGKRKHLRKRSRHERSRSDLDLVAPPRTFIRLHSALECQAASHVVAYILHEHPDDVTQTDDRGRMALHWAVTHCRDEAIVDVVLDMDCTKRVPFITPQAAATADCSGKLPLHLAIESRAHVRVISALLQAHPAAGVEPCRIPGFFDETPIHMAAHYGCDLSTVFVLLRVDPSFVQRVL
jgi:Ankyrin repeats (3 copies)